MITRDGAHSPQARTGREEHKASEGSVLRGGKRKMPWGHPPQSMQRGPVVRMTPPMTHRGSVRALQLPRGSGKGS